MSHESQPLDARYFRYIAERTAGDDAFLLDLKRTAAAKGIPPIHIAPEQASFMQILLRLSGAREVVEVGTLAGYSAIAMARALPAGGRVRTIEFDQRHADFAAEWIAKSDVADRIELHRGRGSDVLATFEADGADAAFLDADKASYGAYLPECQRIVRTGGLILADNAFAFGQLFDEAPTDGEAPAMIAFNDEMAAVAGLHGIIVPFGDGLWVAVQQARPSSSPLQGSVGAGSGSPGGRRPGDS